MEEEKTQGSEEQAADEATPATDAPVDGAADEAKPEDESSEPKSDEA